MAAYTAVQFFLWIRCSIKLNTGLVFRAVTQTLRLVTFPRFFGVCNCSKVPFDMPITGFNLGYHGSSRTYF